MSPPTTSGIRSVLVANRGEIARRVFRTCRQLGITTVAVHSDADRDAPFVADADLSVSLPGNTPAETYLRGDLIIAAALQAGAGAIHPGYGFLSENADFARQVAEAGLVWIGPPAEAIAAMGSKVAAKARMRAVGVPVAPDSTTHTPAEIGLPALVKASAGGGGRGMRIVRRAEDLADAIAAAEREAASAFGDGTVFVERYVEHGRHVEVQIVADTHGAVVALFERDCTLQRRHQKVLEESPSPVVDEALRHRMCQAAVNAARAVGYAGAGTVEFLVEPDGSFWFLEMNTRLQVEHPVTELVTGIDLVQVQLDVANGLPLSDQVRTARVHGHAIEVRLCTEDPFNDYRPSSGTFTEVRFDPAVRADSGIESGSVVSPYYDSMVAKLIAHGRTRAEAAGILVGALDRSVLIGPMTNRALLRRLAAGIITEGDTVDPQVDTGWLDRVDLGPAPQPSAMEVGAAAIAVSRRRAGHSPFPIGWRNNPVAAHRLGLGEHEVLYRFGRGGELLELTVDGQAVDTSPDGCRALDRIPVHVEDNRVYVANGAHVLDIVPRFSLPDEAGRAGSTVAPMPGTVLAILVGVGDEVVAGQPLLIIEAMKMEHQIVAPSSGKVTEVLVTVGRQLDHGQPLVVVQ